MMSPTAAKRPKILVRGVNWLGDAIMTTPALLRLREARPKAEITLLTASKLAGLWPSHPALDRVLAIEPDEGLLGLGKRLRAERFDVALVLPNSFRSALEVFLGGIPQRVGYGGNGRGILLSQIVQRSPHALRMHKRSEAEVRRLIATPFPAPRVPAPAAAHHTHHYLTLVSALGCDPAPLAPQIQVPPKEVEEALKKFQVRRPPGGLLLGLNAGAEYGPAKRWPEERFITAAREIQRRTGCGWIIFGGKNDVELAERIARSIRGTETGSEHVTSVAGKTNLRELCALLKACKVLLTNDTGPMHVAAAVGTTVVVPFGSTDPELTGPGLPGSTQHRLIRSEAPCAPCFLRECPIDLRCMGGIEVQKVVSEVMLAMADVV